MTDTGVVLPLDGQARLAPGYDAYMRPAKPWTFTSLAGAGAIRSTTADMLRFGQAVTDPDSPIARAVGITLAERHDTANPRSKLALGWIVLKPEEGREILMHDGVPAATARCWSSSRQRDGRWRRRPTPAPSPLPPTSLSTALPALRSHPRSRSRLPRRHPPSEPRSRCQEPSSTGLSAAMISAMVCCSSSPATATD